MPKKITLATRIILTIFSPILAPLSNRKKLSVFLKEVWSKGKK